MTRYVFSLVVLAALSAGATVPSSAKGWYEPAGGKYKTQTATGSIGYLDEEGFWRFSDIEVDAAGNIVNLVAINELGIDEAMLMILADALKAQIASAQNLERINNMAANLDELLGIGGFEITNPDTGDKYRISIKGGTIAAAVKQRQSDQEGGTEIKNFFPAFTDQRGVGCDNQSIATNNEGRLCIKGWGGLDNSIFVVKDENGLVGEASLVATNGVTLIQDREDGKGGSGCAYDLTFGLAGWNSPGSGAAKCEDSLSDMLSGRKDTGTSHYVLTRYSTGGVLHYTPLGRLDPGNAIKFTGTDGSEAVAGSGGVTNDVTFASATNSNVRVSVDSGVEGSVTITIGVYYK